MKKLSLIVQSLLIFLIPYLYFSVPTFADDLLPNIQPEQGRAGWKTPVTDSYDGRVLGERYTEVVFWNVGERSKDPTHAKAFMRNDCAKSTVPGCGGGGTVEGTFSGGPNGIMTISGYEYKLHDGQYFETGSGGNTFKFDVENPEIFSKYNWEWDTASPESPTEETKLEDSGVAFSDLFGQVEVNIPNEDGTYDEEKWDFAKLDGKTLPVGTHIKTSENSGGYISFADMTTFTLKPGSEIILSSPAAKDSQVKLLAGNLWINVKKMFKDGSMEIEMSQAVAGIKGTRFVVSENGTESTIKVTEGTVKYTSKSTGESVDVARGESMTASAQGLSEKITFDPSEEEGKWQEIERSLKKSAGNNKNTMYLWGGIGVAAVIGMLIRKSVGHSQ